MHKIRRQSDLTLSHSKERAPVVWWKEEDDVMRFDRGAKTITDCCELRFGCMFQGQILINILRTKQDRNYLKFVSPTKWEAIESSSHLSMGMQLYADTSCKLHPSKFVRNEESWELLKRKGFIKGSCFIELEKDGCAVCVIGMTRNLLLPNSLCVDDYASSQSRNARATLLLLLSQTLKLHASINFLYEMFLHIL
nr:hypothetical protein Iba_chr10cCG13620 [Ipomoea batatas]